MNKTVVWGVAADSVGAIHRYEDQTQKLPGGGVRAWRTESYEHEPASSYASTHPAPMPMLWGHREQIGRILSLRSAHGNLYAVGECDLEPDDLAALAGDSGLKWSTGTNNRRHEPLRITEISLTPDAAHSGAAGGSLVEAGRGQSLLIVADWLLTRGVASTAIPCGSLSPVPPGALRLSGVHAASPPLERAFDDASASLYM